MAFMQFSFDEMKKLTPLDTVSLFLYKLTSCMKYYTTSAF